MNSYEIVKDEELIRRLRYGESEIMDYILNKYKFLVRKRANAMFLIGGETEDLIQEGMIGLFKAIGDFREEKESSFRHFADICISRQIYKAVEASQRKKHQPLNSYISLQCREAEDSQFFLEHFISPDTSDPEQIIIDRENIRFIEQKIQECLSTMEKEVLKYYLLGMNYREIARQMKKEPKVIDNALQRVKSKLGKGSYD